jgi:hypothetical protein
MTGPASRLGSKISRHDPSMPRANLIPFLARFPIQLQPTRLLIMIQKWDTGYLVSTLTKTAESFRV